MNPFKLIREETVQELNGVVKIYRHEPTGAEYISVENDDNNKVFGITFRTPPSDSTGVAHILEHSVLCGSRKYPLKDPFVQLLKGSLQTFLNAMTYPDKTVYPVASQNIQDFYNLVDVYLDAVFFPRITPAFFRQEGWHYELENLDAPLTCKGVVYNEMKGVYSSPDSLLLEHSQQSLFPDTTYGLDSGGSPSDIPTLTYDEFHDFHETHYHPSNSRIFFCGNDCPKKRMEILEEYLGGFDTLENPPDTSIELQKPFDVPVRVEDTYSAGDEDAKAFLTVNWALPDAVQHFAIIILDQILTGTSGSPLRMALIESGLGEDLAGFGLETHLRQPAWSIGMKGISEENLPAVENLIFETLKKLARDGIDRGDIAAAMNSFEFDLRENNHGSCPQGLSVMLQMLETWLYEWDPLALCAYEAPLAGLKKAIDDNPRYFEDLITHSLLNNMHRTTVTLRPDPKKDAVEEAEELAHLNRVKKSMTKGKLKQTLSAAQRLLAMQKQPDSPAAIKTLPLLQRQDLRKVIRTIPREHEARTGADFLFHDLFTGGITYIDFGFDLHMLDADDLPWVSILGSMLFEMGTETQDFAELSKRIAQQTGGIYTMPMHTAPAGSSKSISRLVLRAKCMTDQIDDMLSIIHDILLTPAFDNVKRFKEVLLEQKSEMESGLIPSGHSAILARLKSHYHEAGRAAEAMGGIDALFFHRDLQTRVDAEWPEILARIESILQKLLRGHVVVNVTADGSDQAQIYTALNKFQDSLPQLGTLKQQDWNFAQPLSRSEALTASSRVNYVGRAINLFDNGYELDGSSLVITKYLRTAWLWEQVRVQGGAYGAICGFDIHNGCLSFASYRDPNLTDTLAVYGKTGQFLKDLTLDKDELTRSLIGTVGGMDSFMLPDAKGYTDMVRWLSGMTEDTRQKLRNEALSTTEKDFNDFGAFIDMTNATTCVLGSKESLSKCDIHFDNTLKVM